MMSDTPTEPTATSRETIQDEAAQAAFTRALRDAKERGFAPGNALRRKRQVGQAPSVSTRRNAYDARDPQLLGSTMDRLLLERGWQVDVAAGAVISRWADIVGPDIAAHAQPKTFENGTLTVRTESTAWASNLTMMASSLLAKIDEAIGVGVVRELQIVGPAAPSWVKGPRRVAGQGPRDTYG